MLLLLFLSFLLTGAISVFHFLEENEEYHENRLFRKEAIIHSSIRYYIDQFPNLSKDSITPFVTPKIREWADINNLDIAFYDIDGQYLVSSREEWHETGLLPNKLNPMFTLEVINGNREMVSVDLDSVTMLVSYKLVSNQFNNAMAIIAIPYMESKTIPEQDFAFLRYLITLYIVLFLLAVVVAIFISNYITRSLTTIGHHLSHTKINKNKPLEWKSNDEIGKLVGEYNRMLKELEEKALILARNERESAWKEMAKQVAHEIKNPLTPMRLMVQHLEFSLQTDDKEQLKEFTRAMIDQIDTMTSIADAFSRFAEMPSLKHEPVDLNALMENAARLYPHLRVDLEVPKDHVVISADRDQLLRVMNNLIKNGWQSVPEEREPHLKLVLKVKKENVLITISDNGQGIPDDKKEQIFEPSFTTKTQGMGLGLAMVQNIVEGLGGKIWVESEIGNGSTFFISLPNGV